MVGILFWGECGVTGVRATETSEEAGYLLEHVPSVAAATCTHARHPRLRPAHQPPSLCRRC
jgi:hypothetical protein